eukprot:TRINITY_DN4441_c0_g1_i2.p1 TRINITY_DN4441_c0_g1~~TRINITY_DN4441_c0_g1_i2.p1  ORF type:complete len:607 (-),score=85.86 TRINITY_DN4441_c0_g1_i2:40-1860(-)
MGGESSKYCCSATNIEKDDLSQQPIAPHISDGSTGYKYDLFLSHKQSEAQDAVATLSFNLKQARSDIRFWLDLEQDPTEQGMYKGVRDSKCFLFYCTENIVFSKYCLLELGWAVELDKPIILVAETDPRHGATDIGRLRDRMPSELKHVFDENVAIPFYRDPAHRAVSIQQILEVVFANHKQVAEEKPVVKREEVLVAVSSSSYLDTKQATANAYQKLVQALRGKTPILIVSNFTVSHDSKVVHQVLNDLADSSTAFLGCTSSAGIIINQFWHSNKDNGFGLFGIYDPDGRYEVGHATTADGVAAACKQALLNAKMDCPPDFIFVFPTPGNEESVLQQLEQAVGAKVPVIGGSSADNSVAGEWKQFSRTCGVSESGCVFALCWPSVLTYGGFCSGFGPSSHTGKITKMHDKRHVATIDGEPAATVYNRWAGGAFDKFMKEKEDSNILAASTLTPLGVQYGSDMDDEPMYVIIHPHLIKKKDQSFTTFKDLKEGDELVCMAGTRQNLTSRISVGVKKLLKTAPFQLEDVIGTYQIFCGGVMMAVKDDMPSVVENLGNALNWKPTMGACTFGEQGTFLDGTAGHGNLMFASLLFSRIRKSSYREQHVS